jgi:hypothetical protein
MATHAEFSARSQRLAVYFDNEHQFETKKVIRGAMILERVDQQGQIDNIVVKYSEVSIQSLLFSIWRVLDARFDSH